MKHSEYVRKTYGVPAKRGMRVIADGHRGVITSIRDAHLRIRLDGEERSLPWHPTWNMIYLNDKDEVLWDGS